MKDNSLQIIDKIIKNYSERNGKHILFKIAERNETFKIHSFEIKEKINFENDSRFIMPIENDSRFIMPVFNYTSNCIDNGNLILNASLNVFTKPKYENKECTKLIPTFKNQNEIIDLVTLSNIYKNNWILKPIIVNCFTKELRPYENGMCNKIVQSKRLIFEILDN